MPQCLNSSLCNRFLSKSCVMNLSHDSLLSLQSHPASLKLLIEAEGEQLLLALEKNE